MADSAWIEAMQDELHQFDRLKVWELVDKPFGKMIYKAKVVMEEQERMKDQLTTDPPIPPKVFLSISQYALEILKKHNMDTLLLHWYTIATIPKLDVDLSENRRQSDYRSKIVTHTLNHARMPVILPKALMDGYSPWWLTSKLDVKETKTALQCLWQSEVRGVISKLCSSNVDEDTTSRLWL
ncbi:hypothetical protein Tco_0678569 [Tanacetum coccineum]|uniref:Uncharacterized protein n=1 Tax=Tanacetum coccineum TaxID=301880 RepID=A0ABQ4XFF9_9ASTR